MHSIRTRTDRQIQHQCSSSTTAWAYPVCMIAARRDPLERLVVRPRQTLGWRVLAGAGLGLLVATMALAQGRGFGGFGGPRGLFHMRPNTRYDGRFTFVRLNYTTAPGGYWYGGWPAWAHGYPLAEQNLMKIMNEVSFMNPRVDDINAIAVDDPALFRYPLAYVIEVDWWAMTDGEASALR